MYIARMCWICRDVGVAFVKTSMGYGFVKQPTSYGAYNYAGATVLHIKLIWETCANLPRKSRSKDRATSVRWMRFSA